MDLDLNHDSPVPLYHQIAESLRYRIATGRVAAGETLPSVREAAEGLGVNMHTVRRAYQELARLGLAESLGPRGTRVLGGAAAGSSSDPEQFAADVLRVARDQFGLGPDEVCDLLAAQAASDSGGEIIHVVECSETQCLGHAAEIESAWDVEARPWCLDQADEPPPGPVIATWFHYNDIRRRWPARLAAIHFVAIHPDPALPERLSPDHAGSVVLCELDEAMAQNIAADLTTILPPEQHRIETRIVREPGEALDSPDTPILFSPRLWSRLSEQQKQSPRAHEVQYVIAADDLRRLGRRFAWRPRVAAVIGS